MKQFKCKICGCKKMEEVLEDVTKTSEITKVIYDENEMSFSFEYGKVTTDNGDILSIRFQCEACGKEVSIDDLMGLVEEKDKK